MKSDQVQDNMLGVCTYLIDRLALRVGNEKGEDEADVLVVGWGGTYGHLTTAVRELQKEERSISLAHFNYIFPLPRNTAEIFSRYKKIIVCELNDGQFAEYLRSSFQDIKFEQHNKLMGLPFTVVELKERFNQLLEDK